MPSPTLWTIHTFAAPHPRPSADTAEGGAAAAALNGGAQCYCLLLHHESVGGRGRAGHEILLVPLLPPNFSIDSKGNASTPTEVLS